MIAPSRLHQTGNGSVSTGNGIEFFPVNHANTFQGRASTMASTYREYDVALRNSIENARLMRNDSSIMECLEARQRAVALLKWHIEPEDDRSLEQKQLAEEMTKVMMRTPRFMEMRRVLQEAVWYGKSAVQVMYNTDWIGGYRRFCILSPDRDTPAWLPIHGDKLVFRHDDLTEFDRSKGRYPFQVGIRVGGSYQKGQKVRGKYEVEPVASQFRGTEAVDRGMAYFVDQEDRQKLIIHKHSIEDGAYEDILSAGSIHGVGVRSRIYWDWIQKQEIQAMLLAYIERYHGGIEIYRFPLGNDEAEKAVDSAIRNRQPGRAALKVPIPMGEDAMQYGVEVFESSMAGVQQMQDLLTNFYGHRIKRYILGQILSSESEATGLGSGVADLHLESLLQIIEYDATGLEETITEEPLRRLQHSNFPSSRGIRLRFKIDTREADSDAKLNAVRQAWEMGARIKESDVLDQCGLSAPTASDRILPAPGGGGAQQPPGLPGMPPEGPPKVQASVPGQIDAQPEQFSASPYGHCPQCGAQGVQRERRVDGNDTCSNGHVYPSKEAMTNPERYSYATQEPDLRSAIEKAAAATDPEPTNAQKLAGNYRKGQFHWNGWTIAIEVPAGGMRRGRNSLGVEWSHQIPVHYGYIRRTESDADGDHIDVFVGPDPESPVVFVVDQVKGNGKFDEHKVMIGFLSEQDAIDAYKASYSSDWQGLKSITAMTVNQFRNWIDDGDSGSPILDQVSRYSADWKEEDHPRDTDGKFTDKGAAVTRKKYKDMTTEERAELKKQREEESRIAREKTVAGSRQFESELKSQPRQRLSSAEIQAIEAEASESRKNRSPEYIQEQISKKAATARTILNSGIVGVDRQFVADVQAEDVHAMLVSAGWTPELISDSGSVYYVRGDDRLRVSDHEVPESAERIHSMEHGRFSWAGQGNQIVLPVDDLDREMMVFIKPPNVQASVPDNVTSQPEAEPAKYSYAAQEPDLRSAIEKAAAETDQEPTEAQKLAGNYRKGQFHWNGWTIAIETPAGGIRRGKNSLGVEWSHQIPVHYGYIRRTESEADGDALDVFIGPEPESPVVFVVDQVKESGQFDEHKVMIGFRSEQDAAEAYRASYSKGWRGLKSITAMTVNQFRAWVEEGNSGSPIEEQVSRYSQKSFQWNEEEHPRNDKGEFVEKANADTRQDASKQGARRSRTDVQFEKPIIGPSGAKLTGYSWKWTWEVNPELDEEVKVSDWDEAVPSDHTGRHIVHQFSVFKDGEPHTTSLESSMKLLGLADDTLPARKVRNLATTAIAIGELEMQLEQEKTKQNANRWAIEGIEAKLKDARRRKDRYEKEAEMMLAGKSPADHYRSTATKALELFHLFKSDHMGNRWANVMVDRLADEWMRRTSATRQERDAVHRDGRAVFNDLAKSINATTWGDKRPKTPDSDWTDAKIRNWFTANGDDAEAAIDAAEEWLSKYHPAFKTE